MAGVLTGAATWRLALALSAVAAIAALLAADAARAMSRTPHNLRNLQSVLTPSEQPAAGLPALPAPRRAAAGTAADSRQLCVFCHTPEAVTAEQARTPPRWQRSVTRDFRYGAYVGELVQPGLPAGPDGLDALGHSMVCLSCHDSVQAPLATGRADDHPIGVPYRGVAAPLSERPENLTDRDLRRLPPIEYRPPSNAMMNERLVWWASSSRNPAQRTRSDLPLYPRRIAESEGGAQDMPFIECGTCHDPHSSNTLFLRVPNSSGQLCMTCHNK